MCYNFLNELSDVDWLLTVHLEGVALPTEFKQFRSFEIIGSGDCPEQVNLFLSTNPLITDKYLNIKFLYDTIYCEYKIVKPITAWNEKNIGEFIDGLVHR